MRAKHSLLVALGIVLFALLGAGCSGASPPPASAPPTSSAVAPSASAAPLAGGASFRGTMTPNGYLSLPEGGAKHPAILLMHEYWGLNDWMRADTDRFAAAGYVALAVDLYRGHVAKDPDEAHELMRGLPEDRALGDMKAAFDALAARSDVDPARIGAVGWCMGGGYALTLATAEPRLRAVAMNYGRLVTDPAKIEAIHAALLGNFAGQDRGIQPDDVRKFEKAMKDAKKDVNVKIYDGAGHAFMNPGNAKGYDKAAADDAWARIDGFFAAKLKS